MNDSTQTSIRAVLKIGGGFLIAKGLANDNQVEVIAAGLASLVAVIWGLLHRSSGAKVVGPTLILIPALLLMPALSGCKTGPDGKRTIDIVKVGQAKALIEPVASSALRRVIQRSPEHAAQIAKYASSVAGVFCTMSLSNNFSPDYLIAEADKFADPALEEIDHGYLIDVKNGAVGIYKLLWGDRFQAEISETNWLHAVCEFFCESINQGLTDAGYPGGVRKTAAGYRRDLNERMNLGRVLTQSPIREPEFAVLPTLWTRDQAPPAFTDAARQGRRALPAPEAVWQVSRR